MTDLILNDISKKEPFGSDFKYYDKFLTIEQEIDNDYSVTSKDGTNWLIVKKSCYEMLTQNTKDIKIVSWWLNSFWKLENFLGLERSLFVFNDFIKKYNNNSFPKSIKAKRNTILWLEQTLTKDIVEKKQHKDKLNNAKELSELFLSLQNELNIIFKDEDKHFSKIIRYLKNSYTKNEEINEVPEIKTSKEVLEKDKKAKQNNNRDKSSIETTKIDIKKITTNEEANKTLQTFKKSASLLSEYYRSTNSYDLKAIKITRLLSWLNIDGLPFNEEKLTQTNPPSDNTLYQIEEARKNNESNTAFILIQHALERSPYWLDGHFKSYEILIQEKQQQEANEIKNALIAFVNSNQGVEELLFKDKTAFASKETKDFLNKDKNDNENKTKEIKTETLVSNKKEKSELINKCYELINNNQKKDAMQVLQNHYNLAISQEEKFKLRLEHAKIAIFCKEFKMALVLLEDLEKDINKYGLDEWQPKLASEVYSLLLKNFYGKQITNEKINSIYENLCKIDISQALNLNTGE